MDAVKVFIGFDQREALAYHVCCQSIIDHSTVPVEFHPLANHHFHDFDGQKDGSNAFNVSRFLVPLFCDFRGHAIFMDGDMVIDGDIAELSAWGETNIYRAVSVIRHDYKTKQARKYLGTAMESANVDYPRKNWSSVMVWNCAHFGNRCLTEDYVREATPTFLHRFQWLKDEEIGSIQGTWNYLVREQAPSSARNYHFTCGVPGIPTYADDHGSWKWHRSLLRSMECAGEKAEDIVYRAVSRIGAP